MVWSTEFTTVFAAFALIIPACIISTRGDRQTTRAQSKKNVTRHTPIQFSPNIKFLLCTMAAMVISGYAAYSNNGVYLDEHPLLAWKFALGLACLIAGMILIRKHERARLLCLFALICVWWSIIGALAEDGVDWFFPATHFALLVVFTLFLPAESLVEQNQLQVT